VEAITISGRRVGVRTPLRPTDDSKMLRDSYHHSEETRRKISQSMLGHAVSEEARKKMSEVAKGRKPWNVGKHLSEETKEKLRKASLGNKNHLGFRHAFSEETKKRISLALMGGKNPAWLGGVSFQPYGKEFNKRLQEMIRVRDNFRCRICAVHQSELSIPLNVHHVDYNKTNNRESNLVSLCASCHSRTNTNREYWKSFFNNQWS